MSSPPRPATGSENTGSGANAASGVSSAAGNGAASSMRRPSGGGGLNRKGPEQQKKKRGGRARHSNARAARDHGNPLDQGGAGNGGAKAGRSMASKQQSLGVSRDSPFSGAKTPRKPAAGRARGPMNYEEPERVMPKRRRPMRRTVPSKLSVGSILPGSGSELQQVPGRGRRNRGVAPAQQTSIQGEVPGGSEAAVGPSQPEASKRSRSKAKNRLLASSVPMAGSADARTEAGPKSGKALKKNAAAAVSSESPWAEKAPTVDNKAKKQTRKHVSESAHSTSAGSPFYKGSEPTPRKPKARKTYAGARGSSNPLVGGDKAPKPVKQKKSRTYQTTLNLNDGSAEASQAMPQRGASKPELASAPKVQRPRRSPKAKSKTFSSSSDHPLSGEPTVFGGAQVKPDSTRGARANSRTFVSSSDSPFNAPTHDIHKTHPKPKPKPVPRGPLAPKPRRAREPPSSMNSVMSHPRAKTPVRPRRSSSNRELPKALEGKPAGSVPKPHMLERRPKRGASATFARTSPFATHEAQAQAKPTRSRTATSGIGSLGGSGQERPGRRSAPVRQSSSISFGGGGTDAPSSGRRHAAVRRSNTSNSIGFGSGATSTPAKLRTGRSSTGNRSNRSTGLW